MNRTDIRTTLDSIRAETLRADDALAAHPGTTYGGISDAETSADRIGELAAQISGGDYRPAYNGWKNRETWNAALWINNEEGLQDAAVMIVQDALNTDPRAGASLLADDYWTPETVRRSQILEAGDALREWWDELNDPNDASPLSDAWQYALAVIDWYAVADGIAEGMEPSTDDSDADA